MKVAFIASEAVPFVKTGGLADVAGVLPKALERLGCEVKVFLPLYSSIDKNKFSLRPRGNSGDFYIRIGGIEHSVNLFQSTLPGSDVEVFFIDCPDYFNRGSVYTNDPDEDERFILFNKGVMEVIKRLMWSPDIFHCNDWQTGLIPLYLKDNYKYSPLFKQSKSLFSIHNIGYQGRFPYSTLLKADLNEEYFFSDGPVVSGNSFSFLKTGLWFSDIINTVSETYAKEILTPEYGAGLEKLLTFRKDSLFGILNGVDYTLWDPATDPILPFKYSIEDLSGKIKNKQHLMELFNLEFNNNIPLVGIVSRFAEQKGFDIFADAVPDLLNLNARWIILGNGENRYESFFKNLASSYPDKVSCHIGFNDQHSHLIEAGADIFLMPSYYEPCGLNQIYSLKYGTVPVVRKTGGLADTIHDWDELKHNGDFSGNGFSFYDYSGYALFLSVKRAVDTFSHKDIWRQIQFNGMSENYSWDNSASKYFQLYQKMVLNNL
jgi:starch synthase